jgi:hypothetical protein
LERGEGDVNCDQLFWAGNVGSGSHDRGQNPKKLSISKCFFGLPPKADLPPDLRTTPAASSWRTPPSLPRASRHSASPYSITSSAATSMAGGTVSRGRNRRN